MAADRTPSAATTESREDRDERWRDWMERSMQFCPLNLYDETRKLGEYAFSEMLTRIHELEVENDRLAEEVERRAAENARLQDGVIQMVNALWLIYEQAQSVARKPSPA